jgi:Co/Zn/Cd efflux system component
MKAHRRIQIPNLLVYASIYTLIFGIGIWLLIAHKDSPSNWLIYVAMVGSVLAGLVKFILHSRRQHSQSA